MGEPLKHHFLPVFYLKQWAGTDGRLVEFSKPYKNVVKPRRVHPKGTGYVDRLYTIDGLPDELAQEIEREFLSPVDSRAADAMHALLMRKTLSDAQRAAWAAFLGTLLLRMPQDIEKFKEIADRINTALIPRFEQLYMLIRPEVGGPPPEEFRAHMERTAAPMTMQNARKFMSHEKLLGGLNSMSWNVVETDGACHELFCSDRPVVFTDRLGDYNSHLVVPVGPRHLFIATRTDSFFDQLRRIDVDKLVQATNAQTVGAASRLVYGRSDAHLRYVQNRMGTVQTVPLIERLSEAVLDSGLLQEVGRELGSLKRQDLWKEGSPR